MLPRMAMFWSRPTAIIEANIEDPPYDTSGRGTPVTGMMPRHIPMFWKVWKANQQAMPAAATRPNMSSACIEMCSARHSSTANSRISTPAPISPSSSPATVKMKSVCCSGTNRERVCEPSNSPWPNRPPLPIAIRAWVVL